MVSELEIRKEQRSWLFELLVVKNNNRESNSSLDQLIAKHKAGMLEEDVALVEKMVSTL